jgi:hypothetical protein
LIAGLRTKPDKSARNILLASLSWAKAKRIDMDLGNISHQAPAFAARSEGDAAPPLVSTGPKSTICFPFTNSVVQ